MKKINLQKKRFIPIVLLYIAAIAICFANFDTVVYADPTPSPTSSELLLSLPLDLKENSVVVCIGQGLKLRKTPVIQDNNIIKVLKNGDRLIFKKWENEGWILVEYQGLQGYCKSDYIKYNPAEQPVPSPTPTHSPSQTPTPLPTQTIKPSPLPTPVSDIPAKVYKNSWETKSIFEKLSNIPVWFIIVVCLGIIALIGYTIFIAKRK
ncbi:MAG: SH3 domain-containing protein [Nanoarchaeota archaeon]|nr:SH3 domain-containing protein [Nanoarchaeota archaeon]